MNIDQLPEGWEARRLEKPDGFLVKSPRVNGVSAGTAVYLDDENPAHRLLALILAARTAPAEPVGVVNAVENKGSTRWDGVIYASAILEGHVKHGTKLYTAPDALQVENERLREQVERLKANFDSDIKFIGENYSEIEAERDALKAIIEGLFRCDEGDNGEHQYHVGWNDCVEYIQAQAAVDRTAKPDDVCPLCNGDCSAANPPVTNCPLDASAKPEVKS